MLIVKGYINREEIDEIMVRNEGCRDDGVCIYGVPNHPNVQNRRDAGYKQLSTARNNRLILTGITEQGEKNA